MGNGNFYFYNELSNKLTKLDTAGVMRFEVSLPRIPIRGDVWYEINHKIIIDEGVVWVIIYPCLEVSKE